MRRVGVVLGVAVVVTLVLGLIFLVALLSTGSVKAYAIPSSAMEPTLHCARPAVGCEADTKDRVLALTEFVSYDRGDLVVFKAPPAAVSACGVGGTYVKRIVGLPGETVRTTLVDGKAYVVVEGSRLDEPYVEDARRDTVAEESVTVPAGHYFLLGDNRAQSCDARIYGPVSEEALIGKLVATYWPPDRITIR